MNFYQYIRPRGNFLYVLYLGLSPVANNWFDTFSSKYIVICSFSFYSEFQFCSISKCRVALGASRQVIPAAIGPPWRHEGDNQ